MFDTVIASYNKLKENDALSVVWHPRVLANYRLFQREVQDRPLVMRSMPPGMEIELTNRCNLACIQCLRSRGLKPYKLGDIEVEHYKRILAQFPYVMNLCLNGFGEPLMHPRFFDIVEYTRKERPWCKIGIYSNGMLIDEEKAYRLMDCGVREVDISIDAAYPDTYHRVRRGGHLPVLHDNIRRLVRIKEETRARFPMIGINFVMLNENEGELVPFVEQAAAFGIDFINCITYAAYDWGFRNRRTPESYRRELDAAANRMSELGVRCKSFPSDDLSWTDPTRPFGCGFFWGSSLRITYAGDVTLGCCTPFKETYSYGNVLQQPFSEIWNGERFQTNRKLAKGHTPPNEACRSCDAFGKRFFTDSTTRVPSVVSACSGCEAAC
jgi:radical SAM protein with 4Fe4S-binding SPASM domain